MITILLVILIFIVAPVIFFGLALCKSAALADRQMEDLRSGIALDYSTKSNHVLARLQNYTKLCQLRI